LSRCGAYYQITNAIVSAAEMVGSGEMSVPIATEYGLEEIGAAIVHAEKGGKVLLTVARREIPRSGRCCPSPCYCPPHVLDAAAKSALMSLLLAASLE
jgi:hypothetical protein